MAAWCCTPSSTCRENVASRIEYVWYISASSILWKILSANIQNSSGHSCNFTCWWHGWIASCSRLWLVSSRLGRETSSWLRIAAHLGRVAPCLWLVATRCGRVTTSLGLVTTCLWGVASCCRRIAPCSWWVATGPWWVATCCWWVSTSRRRVSTSLGWRICPRLSRVATRLLWVSTWLRRVSWIAHVQNLEVTKLWLVPLEYEDHYFALLHLGYLDVKQTWVGFKFLIYFLRLATQLFCPEQHYVLLTWF